MPLIPVVVSVFGVLNDAAADWLEQVQGTARMRGRPFAPEPAGPRTLGQLVALSTILEAASIACEAHSQRCGQIARGGAAGV